ncbi:MAG: hypothetical protein EHM42_06725 [Planctomycetaceae bacterium]|nr:MAG: hypothetical protein EHM42_06725 [Planctomycetaceae bacterium]
MRQFVLFLLLVLACQIQAVAADRTVEPLNEAPSGLSDEVKAVLQESGYRISDKTGVICDIWLVKDLPLKPKFKPSLRVKYPILSGQLVGAIRYPEGGNPTDFRGQPLKPGIFTLRYGLQPDDGNHLGTSDIRDFLVGCPPDKDTRPARVEDLKKLFKLSSGAAGTTHPSIYLLIPPPEKAGEGAAVSFDGEKNLTVFEAVLIGKEGETSLPIPTRIVVQGKTEA